MYSDNDFLAHYGIKGQKWYQRRFQYDDGSLTPEGKKRYSKSKNHADYDRARAKKDVKKMSDVELRATNNRLNMERQYRDLSSTELNTAHKKFKEAIKTAGEISLAITTGIALYNNIGKLKNIKIPSVEDQVYDALQAARKARS